MYRVRNLILVALASLLLASNTFAALTPACTGVGGADDNVISNQATLSYSIGGDPITLVSDDDGVIADPDNPDPTTFSVAALVNVEVNAVTASTTVTGDDMELHFTVTNKGNDTQRYALRLYVGANNDTTDSGAITDDFDMENVRVFVDTSPDGFNPAGDVEYTFTASGALVASGLDADLTPDILGDVGAGDNYFEVRVVADAAPGAYAIYTLKASTHQRESLGDAEVADTNILAESGDPSSCGEPVVEGDLVAATDGVGGVTDDAKDGDHYDTAYYVAANITIQKSVEVLWDPVNGNGAARAAIPGAYVRYTITVTNNGAASATLATITDILTAELGFDENLFDGTGMDPLASPESADDFGFMVTYTKSPAVGAPERALTTPSYYSTANNGDADFDGTNTVDVVFSAVLPAEVGPPAYGAGELKGGEKVSVIFNAILQ